jgi:hypothetical protein
MNIEELKESEQSSKELYTGIANIQIALVNPSRKQLAEFLGVDEEKVKEPNYISSKEGREDFYRLDFWYTNHPDFKTAIKGKFSFFMGLEDRAQSSSGKYQWIDDHSNTVWGESIDAIKAADKTKQYEVYTDYASLRRAKVGEEDLYRLMKAYGNVDTRKSKFRLDDYNKAVTNKSSELDKYFTDFNKRNRGVKVMLTIRDGQYQNVWTKDFLSLESSYYKGIEKSLRDSQYGCKDYFADSLRFTKFTGQLIGDHSAEVAIDFGAPPSSETEQKNQQDLLGQPVPEDLF